MQMAIMEDEIVGAGANDTTNTALTTTPTTHIITGKVRDGEVGDSTHTTAVTTANNNNHYIKRKNAE